MLRYATRQTLTFDPYSGGGGIPSTRNGVVIVKPYSSVIPMWVGFALLRDPHLQRKWGGRSCSTAAVETKR